MNHYLKQILVYFNLRRAITVENALSMFTEAVDNLKQVQDEKAREIEALKVMQEALADQQLIATEVMGKASRIGFNIRKVLEE